MDKKPIYKQYMFWLVVVGPLLIALAIVGYLITDWNPLLLIILGGVGVLLIIVGLLFSFNKKKSYLELTPAEILSNRVRRKVLVSVPEFGEKAAGATVKYGTRLADLTLSTSSAVNDKITRFNQIVRKVKKKIYQYVILTVLSVLLSTTGVGEVLFVGEIASLVGLTGGSTLGSLVGVGGSALSTVGTNVGSAALTTVGTNVSSVVGSTAGTIGLSMAQRIGTDAVQAGLKYGSDKVSEKYS